MDEVQQQTLEFNREKLAYIRKMKISLKELLDEVLGGECGDPRVRADGGAGRARVRSGGWNSADAAEGRICASKLARLCHLFSTLRHRGDDGARIFVPLPAAPEPVELAHVGVEDGGDIGDQCAFLCATEWVVVDNMNGGAPSGEAGAEDVDSKPGESVGIGYDHDITLSLTHRLDESVESVSGVIDSAPDVLDGPDESESVPGAVPV